MVEHGVPRGLSEGIKEAASKGGGIARTIKKMRRELERQAGAARIAAEERAKDAEDEMKRQWRIKLEDFDKRKSGIGKTVDYDKVDIDDELLEDEFVGLVIEGSPKKLSAWERFKLFWRRVWARIARALARFWAWLTGKKKKKGARTRPKLRGHKLLLKDVGIWDRFGKALFTSPELTREIDRRIIEKRGHGKSLSKITHRDRYMEDAAEAFNQYVREKRHEIKKRAKKKKKKHETRIRELDEDERIERRKFEKRLEELAREREAELRKIQTDLEEKSLDEVQAKLTSYFEGLGYLRKARGGLEVTSRLVDRFAEIIFQAELKALPARLQARTGIQGARQGTFEKSRLLTVHEASRMDILETLIRSRMQHPDYRHIEDDDILIYREVSSERTHVVLMFDKSSSMEENDRILAAKKAVLALYKAAKRANSRNIVDLVAFDTRVNVTDLIQLWESEPSGFTNMGEALKVARNLVRDTRADRKIVYLITDGLPEAFTDEKGRAKAGDRAMSLSFALREASRLGQIKHQRLVLILLEPEDPLYKDAATEIVGKAAGSLIITDPQHLAGEMLVDYARS